MLCCSTQWARELTGKARDKAQAERNQAVKAKKAEGKSNREIAKEAGVAESTVRNVLAGAQKGKRRVSAHPERSPTTSDPIEADPTDPRQIDLKEVWVETPREPTGADIARAKLTEMETPRAQRWHKALAALREVNQQASWCWPTAGRYRPSWSSPKLALALPLERAYESLFVAVASEQRDLVELSSDFGWMEQHTALEEGETAVRKRISWLTLPEVRQVIALKRRKAAQAAAMADRLRNLVDEHPEWEAQPQLTLSDVVFGDKDWPGDSRSKPPLDGTSLRSLCSAA